MAGEMKIDAELDRIVYTDEPTGLHNRRYAYTALRERIDWGAIRSPAAIAVLAVNRPDGLREGLVPAFVRDVGRKLKEIADPESIVVRWSSDAYAILFPQRTRDVALQVAQNFAEELGASPVQGIHPTFFIGAAGRPEDGTLPSAILDAAGRALRAARRGGPGTAAVAPPPAEDPDVFARIPARVTIGREKIRDRISELLADLRKPTFLFAHGGPGYGKSRFLTDALQLAWSTGVAVARADGEESARHSPYRTVGLLLERIGREMPDLELRVEDRLTSEHLLALRVISPNFFTAGDLDAAAELPNPQIAGAAVQELLRLISRLRGSIVVGVGNAALADPSSLEVLKSLINAPLPLLMIMTADDVRGVAPDGESALPALLETLRKQRRVEEIEVPPLTDEQAGRLYDALVPGRPPNPAFDAALVAKGKGSPLYVEEAVRGAALGTKPPPAEPSLLPATVRHAILASLGALPGSVREMLSCASVMGSSFDVDLLQEMLAWRDLELQDAIDRAVHARILRIADPRVPEVLEFSCTLARSACYDSIDLLTRKRYHARIGKICEARLPDDAGWLVEAAMFHLERSGSGDRAEALRALRDRRASSAAGPVGARLQRVQPGTVALSAEQQGLFDTLARALVGALRIGRLYPQGSSLASGFNQQVKASIDQLLAQVTPLTLAIDGQLLKVNNVSIPVRPGSAREDLRNVIEDRLIGSLTFARGITNDELDAVIGGLSETIVHSAMAVDHWDKFLIARGLRNVDIVQKAYVAHRAGIAEVHAERTFDQAGIKLLHEAFRYFKAGADCLKLYPPGHALVEESLRSAEKPFENLLKEYPSVTIAVAEGKLLANGKPIEHRAMVETGDFLMDQITRRKLLSISITAGLTPEEIRVFAQFLALPVDDADARLRGERLLVESDIRHFRFGARVYARRESVKDGEQARAEVDDVLPAKPGVGKAPKRVSVSPRSRADVRARVLLAKPPTDLLTESFEKSFAPLLEALNYGSMCDLAIQLVQHLCAAARDASPDNRAHALRILGRGFVGAASETQRMIVGASATALRDAVLNETIQPVVRALVDTLGLWCGAAASAGAFAPLLEVLRQGVALRRINPATPPNVAALLNELGRSISQKKFMPALLERMRKGNRDDREMAATLLASLGDTSISPMVEAIVEERTVHVRQALAGALKLLGTSGVAALVRQVQPDAPRDRVVAVLEVIELAGIAGLDEAFLHAMQHLDAPVRDAAVALVKRLPKGTSTGIVRRAIKELPEEMRPQLIRLAADARLTDLSPDIGRLLETDPIEAVTTACCHYFAAVPTRAVVPALVKIVDTRPRLFGVVRGYADDVRAAAVWALGQIGTPDAKQALERASKESNTTVRMAATQAIKAGPAKTDTTRREAPTASGQGTRSFPAPSTGGQGTRSFPAPSTSGQGTRSFPPPPPEPPPPPTGHDTKSRPRPPEPPPPEPEQKT